MTRALAALLAAAVIISASAAEPPRFAAVDVLVDSGAERLAAWQAELTYDHSGVSVLSLEGGESEGWREPPYYDPQGMTGGRMVIAAFASDDALATAGRVRVARLHLMIEGAGARLPEIRLVTAAKPGGERIPVLIGLGALEGKER